VPFQARKADIDHALWGGPFSGEAALGKIALIDLLAVDDAFADLGIHLHRVARIERRQMAEIDFGLHRINAAIDEIELAAIAGDALGEQRGGSPTDELPAMVQRAGPGFRRHGGIVNPGNDIECVRVPQTSGTYEVAHITPREPIHVIIK